MGFRIVHGDILDFQADAIVNPTDRWYSGDGGVDCQIHNAVGSALREATSRLAQLHLGEAKVTDGFNLKARYIIHTSAPHWHGEDNLAEALLGSCYRNSIATARLLGCRSIAFPLIGSKGKGIPKEIALTTAIDAIYECIDENNDIDVSLLIYNEKTDPRYDELLESVQSYIAENYEPFDEDLEEGMAVSQVAEPAAFMASIPRAMDVHDLIYHPTPGRLEKIELDEDFATTLGRHIDKSGLKQSDIYDQLEMSKTGFWKIIKGKVNPNRLTVFALAIALRLDLEQTEDLLMKAGYAINRSSVQDMVLAGLITNGIYDRNIIDDLLYDLDLMPLPGSAN
ncbi:MAG: macro domain-containing protein [Spirochaetales bacterium]|nr:macro domain-containing protein [Spirochaetales bacterium]